MKKFLILTAMFAMLMTFMLSVDATASPTSHRTPAIGAEFQTTAAPAITSVAAQTFGITTTDSLKTADESVIGSAKEAQDKTLMKSTAIATDSPTVAAQKVIVLTRTSKGQRTVLQANVIAGGAETKFLTAAVETSLTVEKSGRKIIRI